MPGSGPFGSRGGARRGSGRFRPNRDDQTRCKDLFRWSFKKIILLFS